MYTVHSSVRESEQWVTYYDYQIRLYVYRLYMYASIGVFVQHSLRAMKS